MTYEKNQRIEQLNLFLSNFELFSKKRIFIKTYADVSKNKIFDFSIKYTFKELEVIPGNLLNELNIFCDKNNLIYNISAYENTLNLTIYKIII